MNMCNIYFCKKHNLKENSYIPYQLTLKELDLILNRQRKNFSFLTDDVVDKIKRILTFKIPYYVGPLSEKDRLNNVSMKTVAAFGQPLFYVQEI